MNIRRFFGKCLSAYYIIKAKAQPGFSQAGEDQLVRYLFNTLKIPKPSYLDIGVNHPIIGNNTYYFYLRGSRGVCVEPDPGFYSLIKKHRRRDVILQTGIGSEKNPGMDLYSIPATLTAAGIPFSADEASGRKRESGIAFIEIQKCSAGNDKFGDRKKYFLILTRILSPSTWKVWILLFSIHWISTGSNQKSFVWRR